MLSIEEEQGMLQKAQAIPTLQTNNKISPADSNDTSINFIPTVNLPPVANPGMLINKNNN